ncbi:MAG: C25 family peptidase propeptide domain-containing protein, partial [bacterium]
MKNVLLRLILVVVLIPVAIPLISGEIEINQGNTVLRFTLNTYQQLSFENSVASILFRDVQTKLGEFSELSIVGYGYSSEVGDPKLPVTRRLIELPWNATAEIEITKQEFREFDL